MERLTSYLIERYIGAFPTWLHPIQVVVMPLTDVQRSYAEQVVERLRRARLRVELDARSQKVDRKVRDAKLQKVPYIIVVGPKEVESGQLSVRDRSDKQVQETPDAFVERVSQEVAERRR
jgi:threonyl-tRNA synthetase